MKTIFKSCLAVITVAMSPCAALADSPRRFLQHALEGDNSEIMLGQLAADKARDPQVREFGRMLSADHSQAREEVIGLGGRMGVRRNRDLSQGAKDERDRLKRMDGREFDREFVRYMIQGHRMDVSDFQNEVREGHGPVSDLAARQLPTLQKHLDMALDLDGGRQNERNDRYDSGNRNDGSNQDHHDDRDSGSYNRDGYGDGRRNDSNR
jgi:putative membrane protein